MSASKIYFLLYSYYILSTFVDILKSNYKRLFIIVQSF